jgi:hypothetical protein
MNDGDSFLREVDEAVRQEQYKKLWDKYGLYVLALAVLVIAGVAAYKGWTYWQERKAQQAGGDFTQALTLEDGADPVKAKKAFESLIKKGPEGYRVLSQFQLAAAEAKAGEADKAVAAYDALATDASVDPILQDLATVQAATLRLDSANYNEIERRVKGLINSSSPWRFSARELLGLSAYQHNNMDSAEKQFTALLGDPGTPPNMRETAKVMLALIAGGPAPASAKTD